MLKSTLKEKIPLVKARVRSFLDARQHPNWQALVFALIIAGIGGYLIYHSFALTPLETPTNLTQITQSDGTVNLSWTASSGQSVAGYKIYQYFPPDYAEDDTSEATSSYIGTTTSTNYQVTGLNPGGAYSFYVVAVDSSGTASSPTNQILADTSARLSTPDSSGNSPAHCTPSASFPYCNPFGDQNCDNVNKTPDDRTDDCVRSCTGPSNCGGSCLIVPKTDTLGNTGTCRPMTMQTCLVGDPTKKIYQTAPTLSPALVDQGVDYNVASTESGCTENNPNPKDTLKGYQNDTKTNTRIYAMGVGVIKCVAANPGNGQNLTLTDYCPDTTNARIPKGIGTYLVYQLTAKKRLKDGTLVNAAATGRKIYVAEDCALASNAVRDVTAVGGTGTSRGDKYLGKRWYVGARVNKNSVLCELPPNGGLEIGWANEDKQVIDGHTTYSEALSASYQCFLEKNRLDNQPKNRDWSTAWGNSFNLFVQKAAFNNLLFKGQGGIRAFQDCADFRLQAKYKNSAWY